MASLEYSDNSPKVIKYLQQKGAAYHRAMLRAVRVGVENFIGDFTETHLGIVDGRSGPKNPTKRTTDFGLRTATGNLKRSIYTQLTEDGAKTGIAAKYAWIHEKGGDIHHYAHTRIGQERTFKVREGRKTKKMTFKLNPFSVGEYVVHIEPRLKFREAWKYLGNTFIYKSINAALKTPS
jgi:hypothetical protein